MRETLSQFLMSTILSLKNVCENGPVSEFCFDIDLKDYLNIIFLRLKNIQICSKDFVKCKGLCYIGFEILSVNTNDSIK